MNGRRMVGRGRSSYGEVSPRALQRSTPLDDVKGGLQDYVADLTAMILSQRDCLPKAANGRPIAPSDPYAAQVWKDLQNDRSGAVRQIVAVLLTNANDGVPAYVLIAVCRRLEAIVLARQADRRPVPLRALNVAETRAGHALDLAQLDVIAREDDPDALARVVRAADVAVAATQAVREECERRLVVMRGGGRTTPGRAPDIRIAQ